MRLQLHNLVRTPCWADQQAILPAEPCCRLFQLILAEKQLQKSPALHAQAYFYSILYKGDWQFPEPAVLDSCKQNLQTRRVFGLRIELIYRHQDIQNRNIGNAPTSLNASCPIGNIQTSFCRLPSPPRSASDQSRLGLGRGKDHPLHSSVLV